MPYEVVLESTGNMLYEIILATGAVAGAITAIMALLIVIFKPIRRYLQRVFGTNKAQLALMRSEITSIYYKYLPSKSLPIYVRENLIMLNSVYVEAGGNCYIKTIFNDMMAWDVVST